MFNRFPGRRPISPAMERMQIMQQMMQQGQPQQGPPQGGPREGPQGQPQMPPGLETSPPQPSMSHPDQHPGMGEQQSSGGPDAAPVRHRSPLLAGAEEGMKA